MQYLISVINDRPTVADPDEQAAVDVFNDRLQAEGYWVFAGGLAMPDAATMKMNLVGQASSGALMNRVTAGDIDKSYLLYKIYGQQFAVPGGGGGTMPTGGMLSDSEICVFVDWVSGGAK